MFVVGGRGGGMCAKNRTFVNRSSSLGDHPYCIGGKGMIARREGDGRVRKRGADLTCCLGREVLAAKKRRTWMGKIARVLGREEK